ncbi:MAG: response regulator transcription factor [Eubacterium sp.]|nr:response regulator transcription factor [Eubacterium sp.]
MHIMIIEDDPGIRQELAAFLKRYGYKVTAPEDFEHLVPAVLSSDADLLLLDLNLPVYDGYYICREIRKQSELPIIIVTSRDSEMDELMSMNLGADDFVTKPYNTQILLARITSVLKRTHPKTQGSQLSHKGLTLDLSRGSVYFGGEEAELTKNEIGLLNILISRKDQIVSREDLMNALWQSDAFVDDNTLTVNINRLRKKLDALGAADYLITKRGQGYMV